MAEIELYEHEKKYKSSLKTLEESSTSERNKILIKEFLNDCTIGWGERSLGKPDL
ncbi:MAG: hypothetical protein HY930_00160 [Euryarchaeota archaeon]|nr:hypothetical protein [Euryarchaeota archaeon]